MKVGYRRISTVALERRFQVVYLEHFRSKETRQEKNELHVYPFLARYQSYVM